MGLASVMNLLHVTNFGWKLVKFYPYMLMKVLVTFEKKRVDVVLISDIFFFCRKILINKIYIAVPQLCR